MDALVMLLFLAAVAGVWWWLAKRMKQGGRGWFLRHVAGSSAGFFAGLIVVSLAIELGIIATTPKPGGDSVAVAASADTTTTQKATPISYSITQDEYREGRPRKVEVTLPRRLSDAELAEVAAAVRDDTNVSAERTFIGFRVEGQTADTYWANASFEPDYKSHVIGMSADGYQKLISLDLSGYPDLVGNWIRDGALGHALVLYKKDGKYFMDSYFDDGSKGTEAYTTKPLDQGELRLEQPGNDFGEYYILKKDGTLQGWSENGMYLSLPKVR